MGLIKDTVAGYSVSRHAAIGFAWRYGCVVEENIELVFRQRAKTPTKSGRVCGTFESLENGQKFKLVVEKNSVITALPMSERLGTREAEIIKNMYETQDIWAPGSIDLADIVIVRNTFISEGKPFSKDVVRKAMLDSRSQVSHSQQISAEDALEKLGLDFEFYGEGFSIKFLRH